MTKKIFAYKKPFCFAWVGGRLIIMKEDQSFVDFSDGGMSRGFFGHHAKRKHNILGDIEVTNTLFKFNDYDLEFDFKTLENCYWLDKNKVKGKLKYESTVIHHLKRFCKKRKNEH